MAAGDAPQTEKEIRLQRLLRKYYPEIDFGGYTTVNGTIPFYQRVNALLKPDSRVLDLGCGRGEWQDNLEELGNSMRNFKGRCQRVLGIDMTEAGLENASLDEFRKIEGPRWPVEDGSIDLIVCDYVIEHIPDVDGFFSEVSRILDKGGVICLRTPNKLYYVSVISRLVPNKFHAKLVGHAQADRKEEDVFETVYRCNTGGALKKTFKRHGLEGVVIYHESEPMYMSFHPIAFWLGVMHQRFAPKFVRANLFGFARKL